MKRNGTKKQTVNVAKILRGISFSPPNDEWLKKHCPNVCELLHPQWSGQVMTRQAARVTMKADSGHYFVTLECPTEGLTTTFTVDTLEHVWEVMEGIVSSGKAVWTPTWKIRKKHSPVVADAIE